MAPAVCKLSVVFVQLHSGVPRPCHDYVRAGKDLAGGLVVSAALHNQLVDIVLRCEAAVRVQAHPQRGALEGWGPALVGAMQVPASTTVLS